MGKAQLMEIGKKGLILRNEERGEPGPWKEKNKL